MIITTDKDFLTRLETLRGTGPLVLDIETGNGVNPWDREAPAYMVGIALGLLDDPSTDTYFSFGHEGGNISYELLPQLIALIDGREITGWNLSFDFKLLTFCGLKLPKKMRDGIIAAHLVNENEESLALKNMGRLYFGDAAGAEQDELKLALKTLKLTMGQLQHTPASLVGPYAIQDIKLTRNMTAFLETLLVKWRLTDLFDQVCEFALALVEMMLTGLLIDPEEVHRQIKMIGPRIVETREEIHRLAGSEINLNSPKQLKEWLKIPKTDKKTLVELLEREERPEVRLLLEYRQLSKATSTYFLPFLALADSNNRLHTELNVTGTVTGRLSSRKPNLQNQSRTQSDRTFSVRSCFVAPPGHFFAEMDYASIEPRLGVHYSKDPEMIAAFHAGLDFHTKIARTIHKREEINSEERTDAKSTGLGLLYGLGAHKLSVKLLLRHAKDECGQYIFHHALAWRFNKETDELEQVPCSLIDAEFCTCAGKDYTAKYFNAWKGLQPCIRAVNDAAATFRYVRNPLSGRCRRFPNPRKDAHKAFNSLIQSSAADILRLALTEIAREDWGPDPVRMVNTVHDSICWEVPFNDRALARLQRIKYIMENVVVLSVPIVVDCKVGMNMSNMGKVDL